MNASMTPVHVRFTPDANELDKLKRAMTPAGPARARRYLVRSTLGPPTIYNRLAPATLQ